MSPKPPSRNPKSYNPYQKQPPIPSMATPRRPEPPKKLGFIGSIFFIGIFGGLVWLGMMIFGWGPYQQQESEITPTVTEILINLLPQTATASSMAGDPAKTATRTPALTLMQTSTKTQIPTQALFPFVLEGEPEAVPSALIRVELGCEWLVIAGQVLDLQFVPVTGSATLHLTGELNGFVIDQVRKAGSMTVYGESGYEFALNGLVIDSEDSLFIQLIDSNGKPLSNIYPIQTFADCQKNLILVNFKQVR